MSVKSAFTSTLYLLLWWPVAVYAQGPCPTATSTTSDTIPSRSGDLICQVPQVFGPGGLVGTDHGGPLSPTTGFGHSAHFISSSIENFSPLNAEIGTQLSQLPLTSPASGFIFSFNPSVGVVTRSTETFGPILTERAETIGKHKLFIGFSYQYFNFDKIDGVNLKGFGAVMKHEDESGLCPSPFITCVNGQPVFQQDIIATQNRVDLKVHQFTFVGTFGVTSRFDVSLAVPILDVRMAASSDARIFSFENSTTSPMCCVHVFDPSEVQAGHETLFPADPIFGFNHALFTNGNSAFGVGDLILRGKYEVLKHEKVGLALGVDVHLPTGDAENFLGAGTWGIRPFVSFSYAARVSPHANFGYQWNGDSILAGDVTLNRKGPLSDVITYSFGADAGLTHRISVTADFIGQTLRDAQKISAATFEDAGGTSHPNIVTSAANINQASIAIGGKVNPIGNLLLTANVLFRVNEAGLHSKPVPLIGISYTF